MASIPSKLFHVVVVGGITLATQACSSDTQGGDAGGKDDASTAKDASNGTDAPVQDASPGGDSSMMMKDAGCLNKPGDCTHGMCAW